jgi:hypothetical protein
MDCEMLGNCGFFKTYCKSETVSNGFTALYCRNKDKSENCERKLYRKKNGTPPPDNMAPTGKML